MTSETPLDATISTQLLSRVIILLIAVWSLIEGLILLAFHGASAGALGAGVDDEAAQRLVGAHLLLLVPAYLLIVLRFDRYQGLTWLPFFAQAVFGLTVGYSILNGETEFTDGILAVAVSAILAGLLGFVWITEQRTLASKKMEADEAALLALEGPHRARPSPGEQT